MCIAFLTLLLSWILHSNLNTPIIFSRKKTLGFNLSFDPAVLIKKRFWKLCNPIFEKSCKMAQKFHNFENSLQVKWKLCKLLMGQKKMLKLQNCTTGIKPQGQKLYTCNVLIWLTFTLVSIGQRAYWRLDLPNTIWCSRQSGSCLILLNTIAIFGSFFQCTPFSSSRSFTYVSAQTSSWPLKEE